MAQRPFNIDTEKALVTYCDLAFGFNARFNGTNRQNAKVTCLMTPWSRSVNFRFLQPDGTWKLEKAAHHEVYHFLDDEVPGWRAQIYPIYRYDVPELSTKRKGPK